MAFTYDPATDAGLVRLLIPDTVSATAIFQDAEIAAFLSIEGDSIKRATALGLETIASNQAMILKVIKILDVQTDGAKLSDALLKRAKELRAQADADDAAVEAAAGATFAWAEFVTNEFSAMDRIEKQALLGG